MRALFWIYTIVSSGYFWMYLMGFDLVVKYATGALWVMMIGGPILLCGAAIRMMLPFIAKI